VGDVVSNAIVILILSIYWSINQRHFELLWLSLLPSSQRKQARSIWRMTESTIGAYIRGQGMQSLLGGLLLGVGYWLIGSPYPALLGLISALAFLVPVAGVAVIVLAPLVVGLLTGIQLGIMTALYALVVLIAVGIWVKPRFFEQRWNDPILTLVLLIALASVFGLPGLIIAPPLSIVCLILWNRLVSHRRSLEAASQISDLRERQERLRITIQAMDEPPPPLVSSSMERLLQLIEKAEPILQAVYPGNVSDGSVSDRTEEKGKNIGKSAS
jgi:predicted PurR-regulated permease PerM